MAFVSIKITAKKATVQFLNYRKLSIF